MITDQYNNAVEASFFTRMKATQETINQEIDAEIAKRSKYDEMWIALDGCRKEIVAGSVLMPLTAEDRAWNEANKRAVRIIETYIQRKGLFQ